MPSTIQSFFATIDPVPAPPQRLWDSALRRNRSHQDETFKLKLLGWRRRVLPPGLPAVRSKFQRHRLATRRPYARSIGKDRLLSAGVAKSSVGQKFGAGEGNRTLVCSLGSCRSAIELRPHIACPHLISRDRARRQAPCHLPPPALNQPPIFQMRPFVTVL